MRRLLFTAVIAGYAITTMATARRLKVPTPEERPTLKVAEVMELLDICESNAYAAINRGEIPSIRIGRRVLIPTAALRKMLGLDQPEATAS